ncbi:MAG TPA: phasin family protein [Steroidobacteraceae bacterium]|nr:phasin family protein [Steroidobacteraceae bacterium]
MARSRRKGGRSSSTASGAQARLIGTMHQIYLAGLGALSKARNGAPELFEELVAEGARVHADTRGAAEKALQGMMADVQERVGAHIGRVRGQAADALDGLEKVFQTRVHRALAQLGVPSAEEVNALSKRVDVLNANIGKLARQSRRTPKTPRTPRTPRTTRTTRSRGGAQTRTAAASAAP